MHICPVCGKRQKMFRENYVCKNDGCPECYKWETMLMHEVFGRTKRKRKWDRMKF